MYGEAPKELTIESILKKVSEWDLWRYYVPEIVLNKAFCSPLRKDTKPSASLFKASNGNLLLKDFGHGVYNIWHFLQIKYGLTFIESLKVVDNDFNLKLSTTPLYEIPTMQFLGVATKDKVEDNTPSIISIKKREWHKQDDLYWRSYGFSREYLDEAKIIPVENYWINGVLVYWYNKYNPAYSIEFGAGKRKIYSPLATKFKWITNANNSIIQGEWFLPEKGENLIITKSYKDVLQLKLLEYCSVASQSESVFIAEDKIVSYKNRFKNIFVLWDNDSTGKKYSEKFCTMYNLFSIFVPEEEAITDISDFYKKYGESKTKILTRNLLEERLLYGKE